MRLTQGQKTPLDAIGVGAKTTVHIDYDAQGVDIVVFGLDAAKKISDDRYTVLFSNPSSPGNAIRMQSGAENTTIDIDFTALPAAIDRLTIVASHDTRPLSGVKPLVVTIGDASFDAGGVLGQEKAAMLVDLYRHSGSWRLSATGQGFAQGLAKLVEHLGGTVDGAPGTTTSAPPAPTPTPPAAKPASQPISLTKITLEKNRGISLEKTGDSYGDIVLNLNWAQNAGKGGFFSSQKALDLDLGCLFELTDGTKGVVQALGKTFGAYQYQPYMELDGDDRSGSNTAGETIRINGKHFAQIKRIAVFALIYEGVANWSETDARISLKMPNQPEIVVEVNDGSNGKRLYGMAIIENVGGTMRVTNHARCYGNQQDFAEAIGLHMQWRRAVKD